MAASDEASAEDPWRYACPECGSTYIAENKDGSHHCGNCYATFDEPVDRKGGSG